MNATYVPLRRYVVSACDGPFGSSLKGEHYTDEGARVIRLGNIGAAAWRGDDAAFIPHEYWSILSRHHALAGDLIVAGLGDEGHPVGRACVLPDIGPALVKADCYRMRIDRRVADSRYLAWFLCSLPGLAAAERIAEGSTRPRLTLGRALGLRVPLLPKDSQRAIADFLDAETARIDALIAKKRRIVELLEEGWSSRLVESLSAANGRWVPLKSVARFREGPGILAVDFRDEGTPLLRIGNLIDDTISLEGCGFLDPADVAVRWRHLVAHVGELIVSGSATSGLPVVVPPEADGAVPYTGLIRIWPAGTSLDRDYLRFFLASKLFTDQVDQLKTGVGLQHWGPSHLSQVRMPLPTLAQQQRVLGILIRQRALVRSAQALLRQQIGLLIEHRQALITAAVTGDLDVHGAVA